MSHQYIYISSHDNQLYKNFKKDDIFINIGSGAFMHQKWINYDFPGHSHYYKKLQGAPGKDFLPIDLSKNLPLPIKNNSVRLVYLSHTIEHLPEDSALFLLKDISRILIKNGVLRIVFPDVEANYFFAKVCSKQIGVDQKVKVNAIIASAYNSFAPSSEYKVSYLMDLFRSKNYDIEIIQKVLKIKDKLKGGFRQKNPDFHLSYWTHDKMLELCIGNFKHYLPRTRGESCVKPFQNTYAFDTTEPQNSLYGEFIK